MPITLEFIRRQRAAVERDIASYQGTPRDENGERVSRNRYTNERGITYIRSTERFRTFAHHPYYFYVGTFTDLSVAVQARESAEAQAMQLLYKAVPEIAPDADNPKRISVRMQKRGTKVIDVEFRVNDLMTGTALFCDYNDVLDWLKRMRKYA